MRYEIHPSVGIARLGNSPEQFYLEPETAGGRPIECRRSGDPILREGAAVPVERYKDDDGRIRRQAARFRVFVYDDGSTKGREVDLIDDVKSVEWTVHVANKKAAWYNFSELEGDLLVPPPADHKPPLKDNSYKSWSTPLRNNSVTDDRQTLIIDPGPRTLSKPGTSAEFSAATVPPDYKFGHFPPAPSQGIAVKTLGGMLIDEGGRLLVLGGFGHAGGDNPITSFAGADTWHDDISDGPVRCKLSLNDGTTVELTAWVIVGSPKFAPELVNIVSLDDIMFDVGVRGLKLAPSMYDEAKFGEGGYNPDYQANFDRDILPIFERLAGYQWVANTPTMTAFSAPKFNPRDASDATKPARLAYFSYWRKPGLTEVDPTGQQDTLTTADGVPMMPLNSGTNSVSNVLIDKFLTLTRTQYFLLGQWAEGKFVVGAVDELGLNPLDRASVGNAVGSPMCPGIEVTWSVRNPAIYSAPYRIKQAQSESYYHQHGLSPSTDECEGGGCEPGDLTKRMAIPWQADFFQCTVQFINFTDPKVNKGAGMPAPPTYYGYWWPPQSPMFVMSPIMDATEQALAGVSSGYQVYYTRGINTFAEMITAWSYLGFVHNRNTAPSRLDYPSFEERERNHDKFGTSSVAVGGLNLSYSDSGATADQPQSMTAPGLGVSVAVGPIGDVVTASTAIFWPMWYLKSETNGAGGRTAAQVASAAVAADEAIGEEAKPIVTSGISRTHRSRH